MSKFEHISADKLISYLKGRSYKWAQVHHTWKPSHKDFTGKNHMSLQQGMYDYHIHTNGWNDIGQHVTLFPDGTFVTGRSFSVTPAGIKGYNTGAFMIEIIGNFDIGHDKLEGEQLKSALKVYNYLTNSNGATIMFHNEEAAKTCPGTGIDKSKFVKAVKDFDGKTVSVSSTSASKPASKPTASGDSVVDYLNVKGINSSFANRKKLAAKHGISNYKGTASQNTTLLKKLKSGSKPVSKLKVTGSVVDYLKSKKIDSSFTNRKKLAAKHGIKSYQGTEAQNSALLSKIIGGSKPTSKPTTKKVTEKTADIQRKLNEYKVNNITVDNLKGPKTYRALVKAYQYELNRQFNAGLVVDGLAGSKTDNAAVTLHENKAYGNLAYLTQAMLYFKGYNIAVDGYWQSDSVKVTKSYQRDVKLTADGKPGKATYKKLIRL